MENLMKILKTDKELAREARNEFIVAKFLEARETYPTTTLNRIFHALSTNPEIKAKGYALTPQSIRTICKTAGVC